MAGVILPGRAAKGRRPVGPIIVNRASPQSHGLLVYHDGHGANQAGDIVTGTLVTSYGARLDESYGFPSRMEVDAEFGWAFHPGWTANYYSVYADQIVGMVGNTAGDWSMSAWVKWAAVPSAFRTVFGPTRSGATGESVCISNESTGSISIHGGGGDSLQVDSGVVPTAGLWYHVLGTRAGSTWRIYVNGVEKATSTNGSGWAGITPDGFFMGDPSGNVIVADPRYYTRAMNSADAWALYAPQSRWDLYWTPGRRVLFDIAGATPTYAPFLFRRPARFVHRSF